MPNEDISRTHQLGNIGIDIALMKKDIEELKMFKDSTIIKLEDINKLNEKLTRLEILLETGFRNMEERLRNDAEDKKLVKGQFLYPFISGAIICGLTVLITKLMG